MMKSTRRGFTLIELLVVIAIIGILSSVVLASLNTARKKGRDARRIADIKQLQLALELYYDAQGQYPTTAATSTLVGNGYIAAMPGDPSNQRAYSYAAYAATAATVGTCSGYHLGADLEVAGNSAFNSDADVTSLAISGSESSVSPNVVCTGSGVDFHGADATQCNALDVGLGCYDVKS
ncbi:MAG: gspG [Candidatus Kaiserbacteria bacterium]|nr:gspG [Candidatus Kaiserbacteria bacterium]